MSDENYDVDAHERLRERVANKADSALWTYKAHFEAADWYKKFSKQANWVTTAAAGILTVALIWKIVPNYVLVLLAISTAAISGYKTASKPEKSAYDHYKAADAYQKLYVDFVDFIYLKLADDTVDLDEKKERFWELSERHQSLNEEMPNMTSKWYERLDGDEIRKQAETTDEMKEALTGCAKRKEEVEK
jgi:hypothetical protein